VSLALDTELDVLTRLFTDAGDALAVVSRDGIVERANSVMAARFETSPERMLGKDLAAIVPREVATSINGLRTRAFVHGERVEWSSRHDGRVWRDTLAPSPSGAVWFHGRDVTEQIRAESGLDAEGRQALFERLLREEKEESLVAIAGGLAHDFNSILVGILSSVSMLQDEVGSSRSALELCDIISTAARRMADMTGQLLMYSRGAPFRPADIDINQVARDVVGMMWGGVPSSLHLVSDLAPQRLVVRGDASQLHQLVLTLVVNALEAVESSGAMVRVRTRPEHDRVRLEVIDDGVGMTEETRARLFEPFFTTKFHGRGLGLAAARGIIEAHGGQVEVRSAPGEGSTFSIELPLCVPASDATSKLRVALFDPDPLIGRMTKRFLRRTEFEVEVFDDAAALESRVRTGAHELAALVIDRVSGRSSVDWTAPPFGDLPVVWLEDSRGDATASELGERPSVSIEKPFEPRSLLRALHEVVSAGRSQSGEAGLDQARHDPAG
jgi:signal transduction histidine kinase